MGPGPLRAAPAVDPRTALRLRLLPWMVRDAVTGRWTGTGRRRLAAAALGTVYLLSPVDAVPELWVPVLGFLDDGLVAAFVAASVRAATTDYVQRGGWRTPRPGPVTVTGQQAPAAGHPRPHRRLPG
ncbi:YkvA family protein [Kineococcus sp. LSe6-4]|uniref:YkvA family protein n=1 Tax=Kineococcus halophytocola TaxID=3234027 RepID=A0ABV4GWU2_9ACTN